MGENGAIVIAARLPRFTSTNSSSTCVLRRVLYLSLIKKRVVSPVNLYEYRYELGRGGLIGQGKLLDAPRSSCITRIANIPHFTFQANKVNKGSVVER